MVLNIVTNAICNSFTPWAYMKLKEKDGKDIGNLTLIIEIATGLVCFFFTLFGPEFIYIMGGDAYKEAIWVVPPVCMSILYIMIYSLISTVTFYYEKTKEIAICSCIAAGANLILNAFFIPIFGMAAAGYTFKMKTMWMISIMFVIMSILCEIVYNYTILRYMLIVIIAVILSVLALKYKEKIKGFIKK